MTFGVIIFIPSLLVVATEAAQRDVSAVIVKITYYLVKREMRNACNILAGKPRCR
jgi:hypothetical protein